MGSLADVPRGLDWGTGPITLLLLIAIVGLVGYYQVRTSRKDEDLVVEEVPSSSTPLADTERRLTGAAPKA